MKKIRNFITDVYECIIGLAILFLSPVLYLMSEWRRGDKRGVLCFVAPFVLIGLATLMVTLVEVWNDQSNEFGQLNESGQRHGHWVILDSEGRKSEGGYVNGKKHGRWIERHAHGSEEGQYVGGKKHGQWVMRLGNEVVYCFVPSDCLHSPGVQSGIDYIKRRVCDEG